MEIVYYVAASLDGYIATREGGIEWLRPYEGGAQDYGYGEFYASVDAVLLGRKTYEQCLSFPEWPYPGKACWIFSRTLSDMSEGAVRFTRESPSRAIRTIAAEGVPLFCGPGPVETLRLLNVRPCANGVLQLRYVNPSAVAG